MAQAMCSDDRINIAQPKSGRLFLLTGISIYVLVRGNTLTCLPVVLVGHRHLPFFGNHSLQLQLTFANSVGFTLLAAVMLHRVLYAIRISGDQHLGSTTCFALIEFITIHCHKMNRSPS